MVQAEAFACQPLDTVTIHSPLKGAFGKGKTQTGVRLRPFAHSRKEPFQLDTPMQSALKNPLELARASQAVFARE